jgi:hypothetical protein
MRIPDLRLAPNDVADKLLHHCAEDIFLGSEMVVDGAGGYLRARCYDFRVVVSARSSLRRGPAARDLLTNCCDVTSR